MFYTLAYIKGDNKKEVKDKKNTSAILGLVDVGRTSTGRRQASSGRKRSGLCF